VVPMLRLVLWTQVVGSFLEESRAINATQKATLPTKALPSRPSLTYQGSPLHPDPLVLIYLLLQP
jgi:hypothetical protein